MVAEERITTKFTGLVAAHGSEEEATFLATQQVDEARHMQFYARFRDEVVAEPQVIAAHVERAREQVSDSFRQIFDEALVEPTSSSLAAPGDCAAKVRFVTLYHVVIESTLGLTSFKFVTDYLSSPDCCRASWRATRRSTTTSSATSGTGFGSCARPCATGPSSPRRCVRRCESCCPPSPSR